MAIEFTQAQLDEIYAFAVDLGRKAGDLLLERIDRQIASDGETAYAYTEKDNAVDIVTQTDEGIPITTSISQRKNVTNLP
jgi:myo-inositol-1(or 4)-monophosphatase